MSNAKPDHRVIEKPAAKRSAAFKILSLLLKNLKFGQLLLAMPDGEVLTFGKGRPREQPEQSQLWRAAGSRGRQGPPRRAQAWARGRPVRWFASGITALVTELGSVGGSTPTHGMRDERGEGGR